MRLWTTFVCRAIQDEETNLKANPILIIAINLRFKVHRTFRNANAEGVSYRYDKAETSK
jgi:hypothetical protein